MSDNADAMKAVQDNLNGEGVLKGNPEVIGLLRELLKDAEAGSIVGIGVSIARGPEAVQARAAGGFPATLVLGLEQLKRIVMDNAFAPKRGAGLLVPSRRM
jgi:hypothetical protein